MGAPSVFGPVPSRRLGRSLGVNNLPCKVCTYSCVYCQAGPTKVKTVERRRFFDPSDLEGALERALRAAGEVDYVTFVPDGEPTLDLLLGKEIELVKQRWGVKVAVLTNASLLWRRDVREDLCCADYVSVKVDCACEALWRVLNRPHEALNFSAVIEGLHAFADEYRGILTVEVMLVQGVNCSRSCAESLAGLLSSLRGLKKVYVAIPVRPPSEPWVRPPAISEAKAFVDVLTSRLGPEKVSTLFQLEEGPFGRSEDDPLAALAKLVEVHPLELGKLRSLAEAYGVDPQELLSRAVEQRIVELVEYQGRLFLVKPRARGG